MTTALSKPRIESIDLLKGLAMVIMALDHTRDYFHASAAIFDPEDPTRTSLAIFFTRWITHFCAPAFSFLAGLSAYMLSKRKSTGELSSFLFKRGLWLVFIELTIVNFSWYFDFQFRTLGLLVIWSLGISMMVLAGLVHLPKNVILGFCLVLIFGHNLLDPVHFDGSILWAILHEQNFFQLTDSFQLLVGYPIIPWIAVMALGYYFGTWYDGSVDGARRKSLFNIIGGVAIALFLVLRLTHLYGDPKPFVHFGSLKQDLVSLLSPNKYPPSLMYLLMTLGGSLLFLANSEKWKGKLVDFFTTFGRVPFFYYVLHIYLLHLIAMGVAEITGAGWQKLILSTWINFDPNMKDFGFKLWIVYVVWIVAVLALYPLCKWFDRYKQSHKEKWWLSYL